jgi:asparagine synthase (glutamine-hydrolysing)
MAGRADPELLSRMTALIHHRGPDDGGVYVSPDGLAGLGNRRLSIIDLSQAGHMPMSNDDQTLWITYNGEVYNFRELRARLEQRGRRFRSGTDTEVILRLYEEHGVDAFKQLNGMFALAIWDTRRHELLLARDRFGVKPLYYAALNEYLLFGSEIKSLLLDRRVPREPDPEAIHYFLSHLWVPGPGTMFNGVRKLPPGHYLRWRAGQIEVRPYWAIEWSEETPGGTAELARELRAILYRAVERHLIADVPLGLYLSGGLDSSALLALMSAITKAPVEAYTIAFRSQDAQLEQSGGDDVRYAELVARHFGAHFHRIQVEPDIVTLLPKVIWHLDEPVADPAAIATLLIAEAARPKVKVLLSGQGADEVFAGYRVHMADRFARPLGWLPGVVRRRMVSPALDMLPAAAPHIPGVHPGLVLAFHRYFGKVLAGAELSPEERYIFNRSYYTQPELLSLYRPELRAQFAAFDAGRRHRSYFAEAPRASFVNRMLHVDLKTFLPELNLTYGDKLSMAASVETRVPFLDYELIEFMARVPARLKLRGLTGKYLLRRAVAGMVPPAIVKRRKAGFGAPIRRWLGADLVEMVDDLLSPDMVRARGYFDPIAVRDLIERDRRGEQDNTYRIWALLTLEIWHQTFADDSA